MNTDYESFLASRRTLAKMGGFEPVFECPMLFDWQKAISRWNCRIGRSADFLDCGLGKTPLQLNWAWNVRVKTNGNVLILCPLAVAQQTRREAEKFGYDMGEVTACRKQTDVKPGINIANYEMLKHFDAGSFAGVVLDESSILKGGLVRETRNIIISQFENTPYRLGCTATPSPNDIMELGNHSDFLGVSSYQEMLSNWFIVDSSNTAHYRLKSHAVKAFWKWVCTWAVSVTNPSDLGYDGSKFVLPPLNIHRHTVDVDTAEGAGDCLFRDGDLSATNLHKEMRLTCDARAAKAAEVVAGDKDNSWILWCNTDYESDALKKAIPDAVDVRGSHKVEVKEQRLTDFTLGKIRILISKPRLAGMGLNWQHCKNALFVGLSYSYEAFYQAVRRTWRFGQLRPVDCHIISAVTEGAVAKAVAEKEAEHKVMQDAMRGAMSEVGLGMVVGRKLLETCGQTPVSVPDFLRRQR